MTYPTIMPALTLDFQNSKQLDPRVTFSRSSGATYINSAGLVVTAAEHEPRFEAEGLLIEESRTNLFDESENLEAWSSGLWTKANNQVISLDGTLNAGSLVPDVGVSSQSSGRMVTHPQPGEYTCSVFAKSNGLTRLKIRFSASSYQAIFDLTGDGSVIQGNDGPTSILKYPNGWYKCIFTINDVVGETAEWQIGHNENTLVDGINGFYVWGMQVEAGSFPTSYIPTSGTELNRAQDIAQMTGENFSSWYGGLTGTYTVEAWNKTDSNQYPIVCDDGTTQTRILFATTANYQLQIRSSGSTSVQLDAQPGAQQPQGMTKYAGSYSPDGASIAYGGVSNTDSSAVIPQCTRLNIGQFSGNTSDITIARISYYNERLTDAELQTITL